MARNCEFSPLAKPLLKLSVSPMDNGQNLGHKNLTERFKWRLSVVKIPMEAPLRVTHHLTAKR